MPHPDGCPTIQELHQQYNGPIPKDLRDAANAGGYLRHSRLQAESRVRFWRGHTLDWLESVRYMRRVAIERDMPVNKDWERKNLTYARDARQRHREALRHLIHVRMLIALREAEGSAS